jgi:hypothetical protein
VHTLIVLIWIPKTCRYLKIYIQVWVKIKVTCQLFLLLNFQEPKCSRNLKRVTKINISLSNYNKILKVVLMIQFCCTETGNCSYSTQMLRCLCSLMKEWNNTVRYVTFPELEYLDRSCSVSNNKDNKRAFHAVSTCKGSVWRAELLECNRRLELSHVTCTRQEFMIIVHVTSTAWIVFDRERRHISIKFANSVYWFLSDDY